MYARIATFESDPSNVDDAIGMVRAEVESGDTPPGLEGAKMLMLVNRETGKGGLGMWRGLPRGLLAQPASATCTTRSPGRPGGEERVDVVERDAERKRIPLILQRESDILQKHVPLGEVESSPQKLAPGRPAAGRCRTEEQVAVNAFRRRPGEEPLFGLAFWEGGDNSCDFLLESGAQVESARPSSAFCDPPHVSGRAERPAVVACVLIPGGSRLGQLILGERDHVAKRCVQVGSDARIVLGQVEVEKPARRCVEELVLKITYGSDPEGRLTR